MATRSTTSIILPTARPSARSRGTRRGSGDRALGGRGHFRFISGVCPVWAVGGNVSYNRI
eukprot:4740768-Prymnesium_polylepis.1